MSIWGYKPTYEPTYAPTAVPGGQPQQGFSQNNPFQAPSSNIGFGQQPGAPNPFFVDFERNVTQAVADPGRVRVGYNQTARPSDLDQSFAAGLVGGPVAAQIDLLGQAGATKRRDTTVRGSFANPLRPLENLGFGGVTESQGFYSRNRPSQQTGLVNSVQGYDPNRARTAGDYLQMVNRLSPDQLRDIDLGAVKRSFSQAAQNLTNSYANTGFARARSDYGYNSAQDELKYLQQAYEAIIRGADRNFSF